MHLLYLFNLAITIFNQYIRLKNHSISLLIYAIPYKFYSFISVFNYIRNKQTKILKHTDKTQVNNKANLAKMLISVVMVGC